MSEYIERRKVAEKIGSLMPKDYICHDCKKSFCCRQTDVAVTISDALFILDRVGRKEYKSIFKQAVEKAKDPRKEECPFLIGAEGEKRCSIYSIRPLTCMIYGISGIPPEKVVKNTFDASFGLGRDIGMPLHQMTGFYMPRECHTQLMQSGKAVLIPTNVGLNAELTRNYIDGFEPKREKIGIKNFALKILSSQATILRVKRTKRFI